AGPGPEPARRDPRRLPLRRLLVKVRLPVDAVRIPLERERAVTQMRDDRIPDLDVVAREVPFGHAVLGEENAVGVRDANRTASDVELVVHRLLRRLRARARRPRGATTLPTCAAGAERGFAPSRGSGAARPRSAPSSARVRAAATPPPGAGSGAGTD